jgi:predicted CXXCH cytochrome family protein
MSNSVQPKSMYLSLAAGLIAGALGLILWVGIVRAAPPSQETDPHPPTADQQCTDCHLNITASWERSPHANAFSDPVFQERWTGLGNPGDCLLCHTSGYQASSNSYQAQGVACVACHGDVPEGHPPAAVSIRGDTEYCGTCHTTTLHEWRLTGHAAATIGCVSCHDPHSQQPLFEEPDNLCINCHKEDMEGYLEDLHYQKDIGCVDCHALVIPPDPIPIDGIVPTGHTFTITPATCVACHTDALHSGFSLPGYEHGAKAGNNGNNNTTQASGENELLQVEYRLPINGLTPEQQIQALEAALASNRLATLFQGGVIGLVLGGSTAWFVAHNTRRTQGRREDENQPEEPEQEEGEDGG